MQRQSSSVFCLLPAQENPKTLPLRFRPADHNCHPTLASRALSHRLLVRLTRTAPSPSDTAGIVDGKPHAGTVTRCNDGFQAAVHLQ
jgi:hypothetical protein